MNDKYKVTVILPVYNAGSYLKPCLDSLVNQTLKEIQIVVVLDCPTDGSDKLVNEYANLYSNIVVITNSENCHVGISRNKALDVAKGKYIGFFDHDDYGEQNMFEKMVIAAEREDADMVFSPFVAVNEDGNEISFWGYPKIEGTTSKDLYMTSIGLSLEDTKDYTQLSAPKTIWNKLYRLEIIKNNQIKFIDTKVAAPEDTPFNIEYMYYCRRIAILPDKLYYHVYHGLNTGNSVEYKSMKKYAEALEYIYQFLESKGELNRKEIRERFNNTVRFNIIVTFLNELRQKGVVYAIKDLRAIKKDYIFISKAYNHHKKVMLIGGFSIKVNILSWIVSII